MFVYVRVPPNNPMNERAPSLGPRPSLPKWATNYKPLHILQTFFQKRELKFDKIWVCR